ncbi:MAG: penicillin-insensitive murein endopeptidase [Thermoleophilaceae bacterium]|nr:penicillin-insensitive murein endopeptidase [Thermoleophilaceae bacterium]
MRARRLAAAAALALTLGATALAIAAPVGFVDEERPLPKAGPAPSPPLVAPAPAGPRPIRWRRSAALGSPAGGKLVRGVRLPAEGRRFLTWDPVLKRSPNRPWRRWGTDRLVRLLLRVARDHGGAHPDAPRLAIGDLSRPHGGDFGVRFGPIGHASHQNGLDADVYYPRSDGRERAPRGAWQIDRRLSQELVDRFTAAGAAVVFVGPSTGLTGARASVLANHDNHLHVRLGP